MHEERETLTKADEIRRILEAKSIALADAIGEDTTCWRPCVPTLQT